jgi:hypothetical protein
VGAIVAEDIQRIEMSGPAGETKRNLKAMVRRHNSGKTTTTTTTMTSIASTANQAKLSPNVYTPRTNNSTSANTSGNSFGNNSGSGRHPGNSGINCRDMFCNYCRMSGSHLEATCYYKQNNIRDGKYKAGDNVRKMAGATTTTKEVQTGVMGCERRWK